MTAPPGSTEAAVDDFATQPVPRTNQTGWLRVAVVSAMVAFSLPTFITGVEVFRAIDPAAAVQATLAGSVLLTVIAGLCGVIGARTHLSSYMLARIAFGRHGAAVVNLAFAVSLLGWFGVNIDLFSGAIVRLLGDTANLAVPAWPIELLAGAVMTVTTIYGFSSINRLSILMVPAMITVTGLLAAAIAGAPPTEDSLGHTSEYSLTFGDAVSSIVGGVIIGAVILPDITRFINRWQGALYTALLSYGLVEAIVMITGGLAAVSMDNDDFLDLLIAIGLSWGAFVLIIAGSWILNALNLYSTALSIEATWPDLRNRSLIFALGALGTLAAFLNILDYFLDFLFYLAIVFVPVAGIIIVDHFFVRPEAYEPTALTRQERLVLPAMVAWLTGSVVALLGAEGVLRISGIAAADAMVVAGLLYGIQQRLLRARAASAAGR